MTLQLDYYFLSPVEVVRVTSKNLEEVAEWCGGRVAQTESRRVEGRMDSYVWVPTPKGASISWAFPGMFITKRLVITMQGEFVTTWSVFRRDYFEKNYFTTPEDAVNRTWEVDHANRRKVAKTNKQLKAGEDVKTVKFIQAGTGAEVEMSLEEAKNAGLVIDFSNAVKTEVTAEVKEPTAEEMVEKEWEQKVLEIIPPAASISAEAMLIAEKVGQTPAFVQAVLDAPTEDLERAKTMIEKELGGVEILEHPETGQIMTPGTQVVPSLKEPRQTTEHEPVLEEKSGGTEIKPAPVKEELVEAWVHDHSYQIRCDDANCTTERYADGIQVFSDKAFSCVPGQDSVEIEMPAAVAERKA